MSYVYIFGYGSLLNPVSRGNTYEATEIIEPVTLTGYQRKVNAASDLFPDLGMNLVPNSDSRVVGVLTKLSEKDLPDLRKREDGYAEINITDQIDVKVEGPVYVFIAPDMPSPDKFIYQTYLDTCLGGVEQSERDQWLADTIIENEIIDDRADPQYGDYVPLTD